MQRELLEAPLGDAPAVRKDDDAVGDALGFCELVGREQNSRVAFRQTPDHPPYRDPSLRVDPGGRLVEEDDVRLADECESQRDALLLAS